MYHSIVWKTKLTDDEQDKYKEMFFKLHTKHVSADQTLLAVLKKELDRELEAAFNDVNARFVLYEDVAHGTIAYITVYERAKFISIRHFAALYNVQDLAKKLLVNIQLEYPNKSFYGICQRSDTDTINFYKNLLNADIGKYFFQEEHPEKLMEDGWTGVSVGLIQA